MIEVGQKAPEFSLPDQNGNVVNLATLKGKQVALMFYPKDNTPGCTAQACTVRDNFSALEAKGVVVLGINADPAELHQKFIADHNLPHNLLTDADCSVMRAYGAWGQKNMYGKIFDGVIRRTVLINSEGTIQHIFKRPKTKEHAQEILKVL